MTWRERIAAARERGGFSAKDVEDIQRMSTCMVGETSAVLGPRAWDYDIRLLDLGLSCQPGAGPIFAVFSNNFNLADRCLDAIEDRVLELKRARGSQEGDGHHEP